MSTDALSGFESELMLATCSPSGAVLHRNAAWQATLGETESLWHLLEENDQLFARQHLTEATTGKMVTNQLFPVRLSNRDEPPYVLFNFLPVQIPENGKLRVHAVTITGEVLAEPTSWTTSHTHRHRMETLGRMTMGIAHDFNNLLSGILGYTELLKSFPVIPDEQSTFTQYVRTIERAATDGATLIQKIQQYIRHEKLSTFVPLDLNELLEECTSLTRPYWYNEPRRKGISIEMDLQFTSLPPLSGSGTELREIFINFILNAVQAMPQGGCITIQTRHDVNRGLEVIFSDTGTGMPEHVRKRIFEPLFTTKGKQGTGMGLAVSYGIIQEHSGTITVTSELGRGTRFVLYFPPAELEEEHIPEATIAPITKHARILVVDDESMVRSVLKKLLSLKGHQIEEAASGAEALETLADRNQTFDLLFTDQAMPQMNGQQLAAEVRQRYPSLPIVLLTGDTDVEQASQYVDVVASKPFKLDRLEEIIQDLV